LILLAVCLAGADSKKQKKEKQPDIEILEVSARRAEDTIRLDGRVRNVSERTIAGLVLHFDFMDSDKAVLTSQNTPLDENNLEPGKEVGFHVQLNDPVRAVSVQINAVDQGDNILRVIKSGPFYIE
jgi:hypothetical protein